MQRSRRIVDERSRSKSQNRYDQQESEEELDQKVEILDVPSLNQRSGALRRMSDERKSNQSFADLTRQQQQALGGLKASQKDDGLRLEFQGISEQPLPSKPNVIINDDLMTFQRKKTIPEELKVSDFNRKYTMQVPRTANPDSRLDPPAQYTEDIESQDQRRHYTAMIDPKDNQSQQSEVRRFYAEESKEL